MIHLLLLSLPHTVLKQLHMITLLLLLLNRLPPDITGGQGLKAFITFFTENNYFTITSNKKLWRDVAGSVALPAGGPLTVAEASLE